jgi:hypothetical protein
LGSRADGAVSGHRDNALIYAPRFRRGLWTDSDAYVEIWSEANSMMGVLWPVANELDAYVRPTGGVSSDTLSWNALSDINDMGRETFVYQVGELQPLRDGSLAGCAEPAERISRRASAFQADRRHCRGPLTVGVRTTLRRVSRSWI